jgi:hypothetical protein
MFVVVQVDEDLQTRDLYVCGTAALELWTKNARNKLIQFWIREVEGISAARVRADGIFPQSGEG